MLLVLRVMGDLISEPPKFFLGEEHGHDLIVLVHVRLEIPAGEKFRDEVGGTQALYMPQVI